jgi:4-carboxymuconolactone decarboxylase
MIMTNQPKQHGGGRKLFGEFAPKLAELTDVVLFEDVWNRSELSARDRSLVTVAVLTAGGNRDQLGFHLGRALDNGVTQEELIEAITHVTFYAGWPKGMSAMTVAKELFTDSK